MCNWQRRVDNRCDAVSSHTFVPQRCTHPGHTQPRRPTQDTGAHRRAAQSNPNEEWLLATVGSASRLHITIPPCFVSQQKSYSPYQPVTVILLMNECTDEILNRNHMASAKPEVFKESSVGQTNAPQSIFFTALGPDEEVEATTVMTQEFIICSG